MISIKHNYTTSEVVKSLQRDNPSKKQTESACIVRWNKYLQLISIAIQKSIILARGDQIADNTLPLEWEKMNKELGECRKFDYLNWFHKNFPLVKILRKGTPGTLTMTELLFDIEIAAISQTPKEAFKSAYEKYLDVLLAWGNGDESLVDYITIDTRSLKAYIESNKIAQTTAKKSNHLDTLQTNLVYAKTILLCAEYLESQGFTAGIPQIVSESDFGRRYYKGLNLQNCPKVVRHAALGKCYQYDLHASVFAWRFSEAKNIDPSIKLPFTMEYLDEKDQRRKMLANELNLSISFEKKIEIVKQLLTAIGFGTRPGNDGVSWVDKTGKRQYLAVSKIIKSPMAREKLLKNPWLIGFIEEQKIVSKVIFDHYKETLRHLNCLENENSGGRLSVNKVLAYLYQQSERNTMERLIESSKEDNTFLLLIHDGFYTNRPVKLLDLRIELEKINPHAAITKEEHRAWGFNDNSEHIKLIHEQELKANDGLISKKYQVNHNYIQKVLNNKRQSTVSNDYDNGLRLDSNYDEELDFIE